MTPSTHDEQALKAYASNLADIIRKTLKVDLPDNFVAIFCWHARRVGASSYEDLGQWTILECLEERQGGRPLDSGTVIRAVDRIRHRIIRGSQRESQDPAHHREDFASAIRANRGESARSEARDYVREILRCADLDPLQLAVLERRALNGDEISEISSSLNISKSSIYRILSNSYIKIRKIMDKMGR